VTLAGGFGFLAAGTRELECFSGLSQPRILPFIGYGSADKLRAEFEIARNLIQPNEKGILPVGVGFLGWLLDKNEELAKEQISVALEYGVQAIWLSFGDRLDYWVDYIRKLNESKCGHKVLFFVQITSAKEAEMAVNVLKADIIVAQGLSFPFFMIDPLIFLTDIGILGTEAGGHGSANGLSLLALVPSVLSVVPPDGPPVLAAGGLVTGAHLAALLALGASGIVIGTRFLLCPESLYTDSQRNALLSADSTQSVRTMAFDEARETLGWPKGIDGRGLHNGSVLSICHFLRH
jgi:nitronate monooxygenase